MSTKKPVPTRPQPTLVPNGDGALLAVWPLYTVRFMFDDGRTVDVVTTRDDSDLRGELLAHCKAERIVGSTVVSAPSPAGAAPTGRARRPRPVEGPVDPPDGPQQDEAEHDE